MNTQIMFEQSELALAAYASLNSSALSAQKASLKDAGISDVQADTFASRYAVLTQYNDTVAEGGMGTSFSATVFKDASGNLTLAIRGTLEAGDFVPTDANIAASGAGYDQIVAMWNWWLRVSNPAGVLVAQYRLVPVPINPNQAVDLNGLWLEPMASAAATGTLVDAINADGDRKLDITGHSLGGHLAMVFGSLFAGVTNQVTVFNAPGFSNTSANQNFFTRLGGSIPSGVNTTNVIADEAPVGVAPWLAIAGLHSRPGVAVNVSIENQWLSDEPNPTTGPWNHSQQMLTDALAVYATLGKLDPSLTSATFKSILAAATVGTAGSLEHIIDALEGIFGINTATLPVGNVNRDSLYQAIYDLQAATADIPAGTLTVRSLTAFNAAQIASIAQNNIAYRYALLNLTPFALVGNDAVYDPHNANGEIDLYDPATGSGNLSDRYLQDRGAMLAWKMQFDTQDQSYGDDWNSLTTSGDWDFIDQATLLDGQPLKLAIDGVSLGAPTHQIVFGSEQADAGAAALTGGDNADRLYGGGGDHFLGGAGGVGVNGGEGDDYVEGGNPVLPYPETQLLYPEGELITGAGEGLHVGRVANDANWRIAA